MSEHAQAGPSRSKPNTPKSKASAKREGGGANAPGPAEASTPSQQAVDEDEDDDRMELATIQGFADKIQRHPQGEAGDEQGARTKIVIPKRGEKDFEPMKEAVNLQEMLLERSREALFGALTGVRGGNSKAMSHALLTPSSPYPRMIITRGHLFDSLGIPVRYPADSNGPAKTFTELLPEEALYLLERGTLQIWYGPSPANAEEAAAGVGEWCEEEFGVKGAVELSVMEGFATFIGRDGLTLERYQAYSYLKRLGYTVQRSRQFLPRHFLTQSRSSEVALPPFRTWWLSIPRWLWQTALAIKRAIMTTASTVTTTGLGLVHRTFSKPWNLRGVRDYPEIFARLRIVPTSHNQPLPPLAPSQTTDMLGPLERNPYLPFWHIWKPATAWSKANWDRGSDEGLLKQKPEYIAAVVNARDVPLPSLSQLAEVFDQLPDEPSGPVQKLGPQYRRPQRPRQQVETPKSLWNRWFTPPPPPKGFNKGDIGALSRGDRALIVAVNDSGNTGWVRFGRTGFADRPVL